MLSLSVERAMSHGHSQLKPCTFFVKDMCHNDMALVHSGLHTFISAIKLSIQIDGLNYGHWIDLTKVSSSIASEIMPPPHLTLASNQRLP